MRLGLSSLCGQDAVHPADLPRAGAGYQEVAGQGVHRAGDAIPGEIRKNIINHN